MAGAPIKVLPQVDPTAGISTAYQDESRIYVNEGSNWDQLQLEIEARDVSVIELGPGTHVLKAPQQFSRPICIIGQGPGKSFVRGELYFSSLLGDNDYQVENITLVQPTANSRAVRIGNVSSVRLENVRFMSANTSWTIARPQLEFESSATSRDVVLVNCAFSLPQASADDVAAFMPGNDSLVVCGSLVFEKGAPTSTCMSIISSAALLAYSALITSPTAIKITGSNGASIRGLTCIRDSTLAGSALHLGDAYNTNTLRIDNLNLISVSQTIAAVGIVSPANNPSILVSDITISEVGTASNWLTILLGFLTPLLNETGIGASAHRGADLPPAF